MNPYLVDVGAGLTAAGLVVEHTGTAAQQSDHTISVDGGPAGRLDLVWNTVYGWHASWSADRTPPNRPCQHSLTVNADPAAVVAEVKRLLAAQTGGLQ